MAKIEQAAQRGRFTVSEMRAMVRESRAFWSSPEGRARQAQLDREKRNRKVMPPRYPSLAHHGTKPAVQLLNRRLNLLQK